MKPDFSQLRIYAMRSSNGVVLREDEYDLSHTGMHGDISHYAINIHDPVDYYTVVGIPVNTYVEVSPSSMRKSPHPEG